MTKTAVNYEQFYCKIFSSALQGSNSAAQVI